MLNRATKFAMWLAAFSLAFSLVCPVAVTPIFVTSHHQAPTVHLTISVAIVAVFPPRVEIVNAHEVVPASLLDATDLGYALRC